MNKWLSRLRPKRKGGQPLTKFFYLSDAEVAYRHLADPTLDPPETRLDSYHIQLEKLRSELSASWTFYLVALGLAFLVKFGLVDSVRSAGVSIDLEGLKHVAIFGLSASTYRLNYISAKYQFIANFFKQVFKRSPPARRADMLSRYPLAFDASSYYLPSVGRLPHMHLVRLPIRMLLMILAMVAFGVVYVVFAGWLWLSLAADLWNASSPLPLFWSRATVGVAAVVLVGAYSLPVDVLIRKRYEHYGLVHLMTRLYDRDYERWAKYSKRIWDVEGR